MTKITAQLRANWIDAITEEFCDDPAYLQPYLDAMSKIADGTELRPTTPFDDYDDGDVDIKIDPHGALLQSLEFFYGTQIPHQTD
jgi:hypothetical protein